MTSILLIDDDPTVRLVLKTALQKQGYEVAVATNGEEGLVQAQKLRPALILCDWMMPIFDGLEVCRQVKANPDLAATYFVLLTARTQVEDRIQGLDTGADDFLSKPIEMNELKAKVRAGLRLYQLNQDLLVQKQALQELNQKLQAELEEAADYVRSLLPTPLEKNITTEWLFKPSTQLGGDCFDYYWLDRDNLAIYLLDVSGHGVGSALLSVSVLNLLRSQSLPHTNFYQPKEVFSALNNNFSSKGDMFFTIWYGVYNLSNRQLVYANAGHPPAILLAPSSATNTPVQRLGSPALPIGVLPDWEFKNEYLDLEKDSILYIFSDGVFEILNSEGRVWGLDNFIRLVTELTQTQQFTLNQLLDKIRSITSTTSFEDDLSILKLHFK